MRNIKLTLCYDGTDFHGWQTQPGLRTVQETLEGALAALGFTGVSAVRQGKVFDIELAEADRAKAEATLKGMCEKLLANTVIENFHVDVS